jgi:hypothetical protein
MKSITLRQLRVHHYIHQLNSERLARNPGNTNAMSKWHTSDAEFHASAVKALNIAVPGPVEKDFAAENQNG